MEELALELCCRELLICPSQVAITSTELVTAFSKRLIVLLTSLVDLAVLMAKSRISSATIAKPRPDSPARADSMVAFKANKLV